MSAANIEFLKEVANRRYIIVGTLQIDFRENMKSNWSRPDAGTRCVRDWKLKLKRRSRWRHGDVHPLCRSPGGSAGEGEGDALTALRETHRGGIDVAGEDGPETIDDGVAALASRGTSDGPEHAGGRRVQNRRDRRRTRRRPTDMGKRSGTGVPWASLSEGCYLWAQQRRGLDSGGTPGGASQRCKLRAGGAFHIHKSDLSLRPIRHQKTGAVWRPMCWSASWPIIAVEDPGSNVQVGGLGDENSRKVLDEIAAIQTVDVIPPMRCGQEFRKRCVEQADAALPILPYKLGLFLPRQPGLWSICSEDF